MKKKREEKLVKDKKEYEEKQRKKNEEKNAKKFVKVGRPTMLRSEKEEVKGTKVVKKELTDE
jgi:hypothetical protein